MSTEEAIETLESKLKEARHLTEEASRKHDETIYKLDREEGEIRLDILARGQQSIYKSSRRFTTNLSLNQREIRYMILY